MAIEKYLDISTSHMTEADSILLNDFNGQLFRVLQDEYGYFVTACNCSDEELKEGGFSDDFIAVCNYAYKQKCCYINFDRDAATVEGLNVNNW